MKKRAMLCLAGTLLAACALVGAGCSSNTHNHDFTGEEKIIKEATCTEKGSKLVKCKDCGETTTVTIPELPHDFTGTETTLKDATCTEQGSKTIQCVHCTATTTVAISVDPTAHDFTGSETVLENATCTSEGSKKVQCTRCSATKTVVIPALSHDFTGKETVLENATCTSEGRKTVQCTRCTVTTEVAIPVDFTAHDFTGKETVLEEATCASEGRKTVQCTRCNATTTQTIPVDPDAHNFTGEETTVKDATCTEEGSKTVKCIYCEETTTQTIPMIPHSYDETTHQCACGAADPAFAEAQIGETYYLSLAEAIAAGGTVKLLKDVDLKKRIQVTNEVTLDLNGKKIYNSVDIWNQAKSIYALIDVAKDGRLTITGNGEVIAKANDCYAIDVWYGGTLIVENGTFAGNLSAIYIGEGHAEIKGGTFSIQQTLGGADPYAQTLNMLDSAAQSGDAGFVVTGGSFMNFDPSHSKSETPVANFVPEGYKVTSETVGDDTVYTVSAEA